MMLKHREDKKTIFISGGSQGIGLETVRRFHAKNYHVITCSRNPQNWALAVKTYPELSHVDFRQVDITEQTQVETLFKDIRNTVDHLDIAVNNASPKIESQGEYALVSSDDLHKTMISVFWAQAMCLKQELQIMSTGGAIVNISSITGFRPAANFAMYSAAKHAVEGITQSLALEAINKGIRINSVAPGVTWTPRWEERITQETTNLKSDVEKAVPIGRFATTSEIVNAVEWLASDMASYVVGHTLVVDGGLSLT